MHFERQSRKTRSRSAAIAVLAALAVPALGSAPVQAQGFPVFDVAHAGAAATDIVNVTNKLNEIKSVIEQLEQVKAQVGEIQSMGGDLLNQVSGQFGDRLNNLTRQSNSMVESAAGGLDDARDAVRNRMFHDPSEPVTVEIRQRVKRARQEQRRDTAQAGYAMALYARNQVSQMAEDFENAAQAASSAEDVRAEVNVNTTVMSQIAMLTVHLAQLNAMYLEMLAAEQIANDQEVTVAGQTTPE